MSIAMHDIHFAYGDKVICDKLNWALPKTGVVCLWGASGCGKTTLLRLLVGLEKAQSGTVDAPSAVSMVFQEDRLLPWKTVWENASLACADAVRVATLLETVGLADHRDRYPNELSGGQQRRVALVRALAAESELLLLDEPFNGLDEQAQKTVLPLIKAVAATRPVVLVTHIAAQAEALGAAVIELKGTPLTGILTPTLPAK
ncbi:MAG: ATP-binding cassette domain-containing protein [Clostridia bacterium]|nr:ATP-binding cassette domain-containing protein [Clostridia bacterium]